MKVLNIPYRISEGGFIDHWLWAGPHATRSQDHVLTPSYLLDFKRPVEWVSPLTIGEESFPWQYANCVADHTLHFTHTSRQPETCRFFAYVELRHESRSRLSLEVDATGQVDLWTNRKQLSSKAQVLGPSMVRYHFSGMGPKGRLGAFIVLTQHFTGHAACLLRVRLSTDKGSGHALTLPTSVDPQRRKGLEEMIEAAYIVQRVCGPLESAIVQWDADLKGQTFLGLNLSKYQGPSYMEVMHTQVNAQATYEMATAPISAPGHYQVTVRPGLDEYYELNQRITQVLDLYLVKSLFEQTPEQTPEERKLLALKQAGEHASPILRALSRTVLDPQGNQRQIWKDFEEEVPKALVDLPVVLAALAVVSQNKEIQARPEVHQHLLPVLQKAMQSLQVAAESGGSRQAFLLAVCRLVLHGMQNPVQDSMGNEVNPSRQDTESIHASMRKWMARGLGGWDSQDQLGQLVTACFLLAGSPLSGELSELSVLILDKAMFTLVLNSWRGVFGGAAPETETASLLDARLGSLASISYQGWGLGLPEGSLSAGVAMAEASYEVPAVIQELGLFVPEELNSEERHIWTKDVPGTDPEVEEEFCRTTFKTPDFMLSSLRDFQSGMEGDRETPWLATMGYNARVHVSQPEFATESDAVPRNFWRGNAVIPRVAQWRETVVALYGKSPNTGLGFTHAHFPQHAFDEISISEQWAFARKGEGYLALFAANGLQAVKKGMGAGRTLCSPGQENVWVCSLSRRDWDGNFDVFQDRIRRSVTVSNQHVQVMPRKGQIWEYGQQIPLSAGGKELKQRSEMHYDSVLCQTPFPASNLLIRGISGAGLDLRFE